MFYPCLRVLPPNWPKPKKKKKKSLRNIPCSTFFKQGLLTMFFIPVGWVFFFFFRFNLLSIPISLLKRRCPRPSRLSHTDEKMTLNSLARESLTFRENLAAQSYQGDVQIRDWWLSKDLKVLYQTSYHTPDIRMLKEKEKEAKTSFYLVSWMLAW